MDSFSSAQRLMTRPVLGLLAVLLVLSGLLHLLWLEHPREVVFDEVHFGKFISAYCCTGERFFDIHPPHAKLLIAGTAWLGGFRGGVPFESISESYAPDVPVAALRLFPALTGMLLPALLFVLLLQLGARVPFAFLGGWLVALENALLVQTRLIALDGLLLLTTFGSVVAYLAGARAQGRARLMWFVVCGACIGLAIGTKFTGLTALALVGLLGLQSLWQHRRQALRAWLGYGAIILGAALVVYLAGWAFHFALLQESGSGDAFHTPQFTGVWPIDFIRETVQLHQVMLSANYNLTATHPYASQWWTWPIMQRPVFYWQGSSRFIYFLGNPVVWWGAAVLGVAAFWGWVTQLGRRTTGRLSPYLWVPMTGYIIAMLPFVRIPRPLFLYHYATPLLFSLLFGILWLSGWSQRFSVSRQWAGYAIVLALSAFFFMYFSAVTYGLPLAESAHPWIFWLTTWR